LATPGNVDKFPDSNLSTPLHTEVDKLDTLHNDNLSNTVVSGQLHATTPISLDDVGGPDSNVMEGVQLVHMDVLGVGQVPNGNLSNSDEGGQVHATTPIPTNGAEHVMEGGQLVHIDVLGSGQVPNGADDMLPADCLEPAICGKLGRCPRAPRCRVTSVAIGVTP
jgi:hypothetical protein